jgi:DNA-binding NarL/FixJ family response regulator
MTMGLRCVIVDDNRALLRSASNLLESEGMSVVGLATSIHEALPLIAELDPDVVLVDIVLGPESGFELARRLAARGDSARSSQTIMISTHDEADFADVIAESPAIGFVSKSKLSATTIGALVASVGHRDATNPSGG